MASDEVRVTAPSGAPDPRRSRSALAPVRVLPVASLAIVLIVAAVVFMQDGPLNIAAFAIVQRATRALPDPFWSMVTLCGTGVAAFALLAPSLTREPRWYAAAIAASALAGAYSTGIKHLFALPRPAAVLDGAQLHVIGETLRSNSFPSGHSITAFTMAAVLVFASTKPMRTAAWALPFAALIALSRIAVGAHWPADLAAGAAGGWVCGAFGVAVANRWRRWNAMAGVRVMGLVSVGIGVSMFIVDLGYPQALALQYALGAIAIVAGCVAMVGPRLDPLLSWFDRATR